MTTNEKYINAILNNSPESIVLIGKNHEILTFNKKIQEVICQYFGKMMQVGDLYYPDYVVESNQPLYLESFNKAINGESVYIQNETVGDDFSIWFEYKVLPVYDEQNEILGVTLSARNIDKEKRAELRVESLSNTLKAILDSTDESITLLSPDYKIIALNSASKDTFKRNTNLDVQVGADFSKLLTDPAHPFYEKFPQALKGVASSVEMPYKDSQGKTLWYRTKFNPVFDECGELIGVSIFAADISEKKRFESKLSDSEERFKQIATLAPIGILITDSLFNIQFSNYAAHGIFQYSENDLQRHSIRDIVDKFNIFEELERAFGSVHTEPLAVQNERYVGIRSNGDFFDIIMGLSSFHSDGKINYIFVIQDISDIKEKDEQISKQSSALRSIAWHQSHVIRAPVARILGLITVLEKENFAPNLTDQQMIFRAISESALELDNVIRGIVELTNEEPLSKSILVR